MNHHRDPHGIERARFPHTRAGQLAYDQHMDRVARPAAVAGAAASGQPAAGKHHPRDPQGKLRAQFPADEHGQRHYDAHMAGTPLQAATVTTGRALTLGDLERGLAATDEATRSIALEFVATPEQAERTAALLLENDPKAAQRFADVRQLAGFLRRRAAAGPDAAPEADGSVRAAFPDDERGERAYQAHLKRAAQATRSD